LATRKQKAKVGLFLVICALLIGGGVLLISGYKHEERTPYVIEFEESVLGLYKGSLVEYLGVPVGTVSSIFVTDQYQAHVEIDITQGQVTLRDGVTAELVIQSLATGAMAISLRGGDAEGPVLPPGSCIPAAKSLIRSFSSQIESLLGDLVAVVENLREALVGLEEGDLALLIHDVDSLVARGQEFLHNANLTLTDVKDDAQGAIQAYKEVAAKVERLAEDTNEAVNLARDKIAQFEVARTEENVNKVLDQVSALAERLEQSAETVDEMTRAALHEADNVEYELRETLRTLNESLESVRVLTDYLQKDPSALIRGKGKPAGGR